MSITSLPAIVESETDAQPSAPKAPPRVRKPSHRRNPWNIATIAAISFSLTFVGVSVALLAGIVPASMTEFIPGMDLGVVLLMAPLVALILAMSMEVLRAAIRGLPRTGTPRTATLLASRATTD